MADRVATARRLPAISVVIPTYNRLSRLQRVLDAILEQTVARADYEIIVVSDGSTDGTDDHLLARSDIVVARQDNSGPGAARNHGVQLARAPLVLFIDDDVVAAPQLVERHLADHGTARDRVVIGPMLNAPDFHYSPWVAWEQDKLYKQYRAMREGVYAATFRQFYTGNASVAKELFAQAGGFDTTLRRAEDVELAYRLDHVGACFVFDEGAAAHHLADRSFESWLGAAAAYGRNDIRFARDLGQDWLLPKMAVEFRERNRLTQRLVAACLHHRRLAGWCGGALALIGRSPVAVPRLTNSALSGLYALTYYRAAGEEFGDPAGFREQLLGAQRAAPR